MVYNKLTLYYLMSLGQNVVKIKITYLLQTIQTVRYNIFTYAKVLNIKNTYQCKSMKLR